MQSRRAPRNGFTMVELMVVIVIVGILSGLAIPTYMRNWQDERLNSATKRTIAWLDDLRRSAIQNSTVCRATIDTTNTSLTGVCDNKSTEQKVLDLQQEIPNSSGLSFSLMGSTPPTWIFTPRGTTTTEGDLHISLAGSDLGRCLTLMRPLGLLRSGKLRSGLCVYTTSY